MKKEWQEYLASPWLSKEPKRRGYWKEYADEVNRLMGTRGTPTLADYKLLEQQTGLNAGVTPISEYNNAINTLEDMLHDTSGLARYYIYPNGREVSNDYNHVRDELKLLKRAKYNNVFYDPASEVEFNWKQANGIE